MQLILLKQNWLYANKPYSLPLSAFMHVDIVLFIIDGVICQYIQSIDHFYGCTFHVQNTKLKKGALGSRVYTQPACGVDGLNLFKFLLL